MKDMILKGINQAQIIEDLLKRKSENQALPGRCDDTLHLRLEDLNKNFNEIVNKYKALKGERKELQSNIEDLVRLNRLLEDDYSKLFKEVSHYKDERNKLDKRVADKLAQQEQLIENFDQVLSHVGQLFSEGKYEDGSNLWAKAHFKPMND